MSRTLILNLIATSVLLLLPGSKSNGEARSMETEALLLENLGSDLLLPRLQDSEALKDLTLGNPRREAPKNDRLTQAVKHMQAAESSLTRQDDSREASGAQSQAIKDLEAMITKLARQKSQCQGGGSKSASKPKPGKPKSGKAGSGSNPGNSSTSSQSGDLAADLEATGKLVKDLWGHLPERQREQILQPLSEDFLPKYATEIEEYFRALADPNHGPVESP